jgi:Tol biopolymer transport system component/tRNA A-37 threonylcarbamoyl transferase component Bud32
MPLESGAHLGPYEVESPLGSGGMADVYKARDSRLDRMVAIKVVRGEFTERFEREAKAISALNHPHICTLHDIGSENGVQYLVMELVEGDTLANRLRKGPLPREQAIRIAREIAAALEAAHRKGIAHRDLKPGNIMLTKTGVKLLDFGLAKMAAPAKTTDAAATLSMQAPVTANNTVIGTPQYMAPEQVEGHDVDSRADIFAFGCVLYEMLSGKRAFEGKSATTVMAAILERDPEPLQTAGAQLDWIIRRCLEKDPDARFQSIHDVSLELERPAAPAAAVSAPRNQWRAAAGWIVAALCLAVMAAMWWKLRVPTQASAPDFVRLTSDAGVTVGPDISPDGKLVVYASDRDNQNNADLYVQQVPHGNPIRLTQTAEDEMFPSFSPDGNSIAFSTNKAGGGIYIMPALGGEPRLLIQGGHKPRFSPDGNSIAYSVGVLTSGDPSTEGSSRALVVPVTGGVPRRIAPDYPVVRDPIWSPDGRTILFIGVAPGSSPMPERRGLWVVPAEGGKIERCGYQGSIWAGNAWKQEGLYTVSLGTNTTNIDLVPLDASGRKAGTPVRITNGAGAHVWPSVSRDGRLVFSTGNERLNVWAVPLDTNTGKVTGAPYRLSNSIALQAHPLLSVDGRKLLFDTMRNGTSQVWQRDLTSGKETQIVAQNGATNSGGFMPQSGRIVYRFGRESYVLDPATGQSSKLVSDGFIGTINLAETMALVRPASGLAAQDLFDLKSGRRVPLLRAEQERWNLYQGHFSPDDRWVVFLAHTSPTESRIYVARLKGMTTIPRSDWLPVTDGKQIVDKPRFSPDGKLIYFTLDREASRSIHAVRFDPESGRTVGEPFLVYDFPGPRLSMAQVNLGLLEISLARDKLVTVLAESNWNIWMADLRKSR